MSIFRRTFAVAALVFGAVLAQSPARAATVTGGYTERAVIAGTGVLDGSSLRAETVQYRRYYRRRRYYRPRRYYRRWRPAPRYYAPRPRYRAALPRAHYNWCFNRYRSYRASDNTFQPYNGPRRRCRSPYVR